MRAIFRILHDIFLWHLIFEEALPGVRASSFLVSTQQITHIPYPQNHAWQSLDGNLTPFFLIKSRGNDHYVLEGKKIALNCLLLKLGLSSVPVRE